MMFLNTSLKNTHKISSLFEKKLTMHHLLIFEMPCPPTRRDMLLYLAKCNCLSDG